MTKATESAKPQYSFLQPNDPVCLIIKATLKPIGDTDRFQPAGFPEVGHVIYDAPRTDGNGNRFKEKVCIVDSPASMANHLETVCLAGAGSLDLHEQLKHLPNVVCVTDRDFQSDGEKITVKKETKHDEVVVSSFTEGHRLASDYFLDSLMNERWVEATKTTSKTRDGKVKEKEVPAHWEGTTFREKLRSDFEIVEVKKDKTYFIPPAKWWKIYKTIFQLVPNSLVHGVMFAKEQIKISRLLTAHLEAFGASRVGRSGVKFDRLGKTTSGQPIFAVDEETANEVRATFIIDLALLRSYGRGTDKGLNDKQKQLLLDLALWKITQLLARPFRYRTQCFLGCAGISVSTESGLLEEIPPKLDETVQACSTDADGTTTREDEKTDDTEPCSSLLSELPALLKNVTIATSIAACEFTTDQTTRVYYPANLLYNVGKDDAEPAAEPDDESEDESGEDLNEEEV